jgi:hypothetical protein
MAATTTLRISRPMVIAVTEPRGDRRYLGNLRINDPRCAAAHL